MPPRFIIGIKMDEAEGTNPQAPRQSPWQSATSLMHSTDE